MGLLLLLGFCLGVGNGASVVFVEASGGFGCGFGFGPGGGFGAVHVERLWRWMGWLVVGAALRSGRYYWNKSVVISDGKGLVDGGWGYAEWKGWERSCGFGF